MTVRGDRSAGAAVGLDDLDRKLLKLLQLDGRMPYRQIARQLGVSEGTIRGRTNRMVDDGILRIVAIADPLRMGNGVLAFILVKVRPGFQQQVVDHIVALPESTYVSDCVGVADIYVQVVCRNSDHLHELLNERIARIEGIDKLDTSIELKMHKLSYDYS